MITDDQLIRVGRIIKTHGVRGELSAETTVDDLESYRAIVCSIDGINVPFFVSAVRSRGVASVLLTIDGIESEHAARMLVGHPFYVLRSEYADNEDEVACDYFTGYTILDEIGKTVGTIVDVDDSTENVLFEVDNDGVQFYVPVVEEFILAIDEDNRTLTMNLPEGLVSAQTE